MVEFSGQSFSSTGGWHIGQATGSGGSGSATVNFHWASRVGIDPTESINVGLFSGFSSGLQTLNAEGEVLNYGSLRIRGRGVVNVNSSGTWLQEGEMTVQAVSTGDATHMQEVFCDPYATIGWLDDERFHIRADVPCAVMVGSVGQPRHPVDRRAAWVLWDPETRVVEFRKTEYDRFRAAQDIAKAGLPLESAMCLLTDAETALLRR